MIVNGPNTNLLRTCKQVHSEYQNGWCRDLFIHIGVGDGKTTITHDSLSLPASFSLEVLKRKIESCTVIISFATILKICTMQDTRRSVERLFSAPGSVGQPWTASEAMVSQLVRMLAELAA